MIWLWGAIVILSCAFSAVLLFLIFATLVEIQSQLFKVQKDAEEIAINGRKDPFAMLATLHAEARKQTVLLQEISDQWGLPVYTDEERDVLQKALAEVAK